MESNYIINKVDVSEDNNRILVVDLTDSDNNNYVVFIEIDENGVAHIQSDWDYISQLDENDDNDRYVLRNRILEIMDKASTWVRDEYKKSKGEE
ncbi:hypothetical protein IKN40_06640 [bacterium]|nr:hypothetical protein [bacterium]